MGRMISCMLLAVLVATSVAVPAEVWADPIKVTFISPSPRTKYPFWNDYISFMETAADSLGIELTVLEATSRYDILDKAHNVLNAQEKPDYLSFIYLAQSSLAVLRLAEEQGVKSVIANTDVTDDERAAAGKPRGRFRHWIGHIFPDDRLAGYQLAAELMDRGGDLGLRTEDGTLRILGVGGNLTASSAIDRRKGLEQALDEDSDVKLDRFVLAKWHRDIACEKTKILLQLYKESRIVWAVNDNTAFGVLDAMKHCGLVPGRDCLTGGIDWSPDGIEAVKDGQMLLTIGGHFMEGAWVLVLLYDYHHGVDFASSGVTMHSQMRTIDRDTLDTYLPVLDRANWGDIDFKHFTKTHNQDLTEYDFSPDAVVNELHQ